MSARLHMVAALTGAKGERDEYLVERPGTHARLMRGALARAAAELRDRRPAAVAWADEATLGGHRVALRWPSPTSELVVEADLRGRVALRADLAALGYEAARRHADGWLELPWCGRATTADTYTPIARAEPPPSPAAISVIVPYRDRPELMRECVAGLAEQRAVARFELVLVDNQSRAESRAEVEALARAALPQWSFQHLQYDAPFNHSAQSNLGVSASAGDVVVLLNNDARLLAPGGLETLARWAMLPDVASAGPRLMRSNGRLCSAGIEIDVSGGGALPRESTVGPLSLLTRGTAGNSFACGAVSRAVWDRLGGLDTEAFPIGYNDVDYALRASAAGLRHLYVGGVAVRHDPGSSRRDAGAEDHLREQLRQRHPTMASCRALDPAAAPLRPTLGARVRATLRRLRTWR